jgi:Glycosyl transferases group 1.
MRKEVLIVSCVYPPEPVVSARLTFDIYKSLKDEGKEVKVLHPKPTRPNGYRFDETASGDGDDIVTNSFTCSQSNLLGRFRESWSFGKATYAYIEEHHDEIESIYANTWPLFSQYHLARAAKKYRIPYFIHIQDIYPESYCFKMPKLIGTWLFRVLLPMDKYVLSNATGIIGISPSMVSYLSESRGVESSKFVLVRNWQDDENYLEAYKSIEKQSDVCEIMYLGSINPTANVSLIINALKALDRSKFHLSVIGNGPNKDHCEELASKMGISVTFGAVSPDQVANKQCEAEVLVLCLKKGIAKTATPSKLTSYMLSGRPIIASVDLDSDCANIIRDVGCGIVVEPDNTDVLSSAIQSISGMSVHQKNEMGKAAFEYAKQKLSKKSNLKLITDLIIGENQ